MNVVIRPAIIKDAKELLAIYSPYVLETAITFEYEVPTLEEFAKRIEKISPRLRIWVSAICFVISDQWFRR